MNKINRLHVTRLLGACALLAALGSWPSGATAAEARDEALRHFNELATSIAAKGLEVRINDQEHSEIELGEEVVFSFRSDRDAYLTAIYLDGHGVATLLYPTQDPQASLIKAGELRRIPPSKGFVATPPLGAESLLVVTTQRPLPQSFFLVNAPSGGAPTVDAELAPGLMRNLLAIAKQLPAGSVSAAQARQTVRLAATDGPQYRAAEIEKHFGSRTRSLRRPKLDLNIHFDFNEATLTDDAKKDLDEVGRALNAQTLANGTFEFAGHTDAVGERDFNQTLSEQRADAACKYLLEHHGIQPERLRSMGYGEDQPLLTGDTAQTRAMNRRVTLKMERSATRGSIPQVPDPDSLDFGSLLAPVAAQ